MINKGIRALSLYGTLLTFMVGWWWCAFPSSLHQGVAHIELPADSFATTASIPQILPYLSTMERDTLHRALGGDVPLMGALMAEWDVDAQILQTHGIQQAKRLSRNSYIRAQILTRIPHNKVSPKCLPQTYLAASFLLALTSPEQIIAIPKGIRERSQLHPLAVTSQIPLDSDRYNSEKLFAANPALAIVSNAYTHPSTIHAFQAQGIPLLAQKNVNTIDDITQSLHEVGHAIHQPQKSELLSLFMEAALIAIDNRLLAMNHLIAEKSDPMTTLYVNYYTQFSVPTRQTLTGQLLARASAAVPIAWLDKSSPVLPHHTIPMDQEQMVSLNPNCLIIATPAPEALWKQIVYSPALATVPAIQNKCLYFVDEAVQQTSDQYIVLAYYDLARSIISANVSHKPNDSQT